ncbi:hypothetical protein RJ640_019447 [Escallonia rubra]|uniref:Uncharacterized protein n=1 Tax=Escallonia rubra TaxID=112253 RepID=A0AA88UAJ4_9ASTE|nr:hypothetical protein RJ640_019447 [Escallonia rubra]
MSPPIIHHRRLLIHHYCSKFTATANQQTHHRRHQPIDPPRPQPLYSPIATTHLQTSSLLPPTCKPITTPPTSEPITASNRFLSPPASQPVPTNCPITSLQTNQLPRPVIFYSDKGGEELCKEELDATGVHSHNPIFSGGGAGQGGAFGFWVVSSSGFDGVMLGCGVVDGVMGRRLRSCEPEFLVSTPERLLELVSVKAVDISRVSLLVIDGQDTLRKDDYLSTIKSTREHISGNPHTLVFNDFLNCRSTPILQSLLPRPVVRLSLNNSVSSQSAYIMQSIHVCASEEDKKAKDSDRQEFVTAIKSKGYFMLTDSVSCNSEVSDSEVRSAVSVVDVDHVIGADLCEFEAVMILKFVLSTDSYIQILSKMARFTVNGVLHSFLTKEDAVVAAPLIKILDQCRLAVPEALRDLCQHHSTSTY